MATRTTAQELSDWFYGLQTTIRIMEGLMMEYEDGTRSKDDYESRFHSQSNLLVENMKKIKPLTEKLLSEGYDKYGRPECSNSENLHSRGGDELAAGTQVSAQEG